MRMQYHPAFRSSPWLTDNDVIARMLGFPVEHHYGRRGARSSGRYRLHEMI